MRQGELQDEVVLPQEPGRESPSQEVEVSSGGALRGEDTEGRKGIAAVDGAVLVAAILVEEVAAGEDNWEDVGGSELGGVGQEVREKEVGIEAVAVAAGAQGWAQV